MFSCIGSSSCDCVCCVLLLLFVSLFLWLVSFLPFGVRSSDDPTPTNTHNNTQHTQKYKNYTTSREGGQQRKGTVSALGTMDAHKQRALTEQTNRNNAAEMCKNGKILIVPNVLSYLVHVLFFLPVFLFCFVCFLVVSCVACACEFNGVAMEAEEKKERKREERGEKRKREEKKGRQVRRTQTGREVRAVHEATPYSPASLHVCVGGSVVFGIDVCVVCSTGRSPLYTILYHPYQHARKRVYTDLLIIIRAV